MCRVEALQAVAGGFVLALSPMAPAFGSLGLNCRPSFGRLPNSRMNLEDLYMYGWMDVYAVCVGWNTYLSIYLSIYIHAHPRPPPRSTRLLIVSSGSCEVSSLGCENTGKD